MEAEDNLILKTDSYKATHWLQLPPKTTKMGSYLESRGGVFPHTLFVGLQPIIKKHLCGIKITKEAVDQAEVFWQAHFGANYFNREGWMRIINKHGGKLPIKIRAVKEGTLVPTSNVLMTIENTDDELPWLTNYIETILMQVWYPITVATNSFECKRLIKKYIMETHGNADSLGFKLHDFGFRGVSSYETSAIGAASHLVNFMGTDTVSGIIHAMKYYNAEMCGFSIPASEHSTTTIWGRQNEVKAYANMLKSYPSGLVAAVVDSYDVYNACDKLIGEELHDDVVKRDGVFILRPDSVHPVEVNSKIIDILWNKFGGSYNEKGFKVLNPKIRIIQGDGIDYKMIEEILLMYKNKNYSTDCIAFGSGGGLLQKFDRDTQQFAIKCSYAIIDGEMVEVFKDPITSKSKKSKKGMLKLHRSANNFSTISSSNESSPMFAGYIDSLETVFENGELVKEYTFDEIRKESEKWL